MRIGTMLFSIEVVAKVGVCCVSAVRGNFQRWRFAA